MSIVLSETSRGLPVIKHSRLGEKFIGAVCKMPESRDVLKDGQPVLNNNGRPRQELVVTMVVMSGTTMEAGLGDTRSVPEPGTLVRRILRGKSYAGWIEQLGALPPTADGMTGLVVGDVFEETSDFGQTYDASGRPTGKMITTQQEIAAVPRGQTLGIYGALSLRRATPQEADWVSIAEAEYERLSQAAKTSTPLSREEDDIF